MSFILDALRKSETARRRSEAPDLFTTMPNAATPTPARRQWPMLAVGGVGVLSLIAALWLFAQRAPAPASAEAPVEAAPSVEANAPPPAPPEPLPADPADTRPAQDVAAIKPQAAPAVPAAQIPAPGEPVIATPAPPPAPSPAPAVESMRDPPAPQVGTPPPGDRIVSIADLDPGTRSQLPPLKLSMHLWNETPSQRFVILDGQRMKEGDAIGEIVIERITRDGAVLAWRGGRLKIALN